MWSPFKDRVIGYVARNRLLKVGRCLVLHPQYEAVPLETVLHR